MQASQDPRLAIRRMNRIGIGTILLLLGGVGGWASTSQLSGAVVAPGTLVVESSVKKVRHPTGGIVSALLVDEGSTVEAGQVLVRLEATTPRTTLGVIRAALKAQLLRKARLVAERDGARSITWPEELAPYQGDRDLAPDFADEKRLFEARRNMLRGQRAQLSERIRQLEEEIRGLTAQQQAKEDELALTAQMLVGVSSLYEKKLVPFERQAALQRHRARLEGERGRLIADIARVRGKISETELEILQLDKDFRTDVLDNLRDADAQISELRERLAAAEEELRRVDIRAPQSGTIHELAVHAPGAVIEEGETILSIVPQADVLVVDLKVQPQDIDQVTVGSNVGVRIMAANQRTTPVLSATVNRVSPDLTREPGSDRAYYLVRARLAHSEAEIPGLDLRAGMPAESYIVTEQRTPLQFLLKPVSEQLARTFREQ